MRKYRPKSASSKRINYGFDLIAGLRAFAATAALADEFAPVQTALVQALAARVERSTLVAHARAELRVSEYLIESEVRIFSRVLEASDGGRRGPAYAHVLPGGLAEALGPTRRAQARAVRALIGRLAGCPHRIDAAVTGEWQARLAAAADRFEAAVDAHREAVTTLEQAFADETNKRAAHAYAVDRVMGQVRAAFPSDASRQNAVFPRVGTGSRARRVSGNPAVPEPADPAAPEPADPAAPEPADPAAPEPAADA
jgi:hypothetical protein